MRPRPDERHTGRLNHALFILLMLTVGSILYIVFKEDPRDLVKAMVVLALVAFLYIYKERVLEAERRRLVKEVVEAQHRVDSLTKTVRANRVEVMQFEHRLEELGSLYEAIRSVNAVTETDKIFDAVLRAALELVGGDRGSLMLVDREHNMLTFASAVGLQDSILKGPGLNIGDRVAGWVAMRGEPVLLTGDLDDNAPFDMKQQREAEMNVAMSVPLRLGDRVIGVLNVGSSVQADKQRFSRSEQRFACLFAEHAAVAVDRAGVLDRSRRLATGNGKEDDELPSSSATVRARNIEN